MSIRLYREGVKFNFKENDMHKENTHMDKESALKALAKLSLLLGYDADEPIVKIAEYSVMCKEAFDLDHKDSIRILWYMFDGML